MKVSQSSNTLHGKSGERIYISQIRLKSNEVSSHCTLEKSCLLRFITFQMQVRSVMVKQAIFDCWMSMVRFQALL